MLRKGIPFVRADERQTKRINALAKVSAQLFASRGYIETSVDDIAAAANVTKGGVYHYFASKTEILYFICSTYVDLDLEDLEQSLAALGESGEKIRFIVSHHIDHYARHTPAAKTLLHEAYNLPPRYLKEVRARERRYFEIASAVIADFTGNRPSKGVLTALTFTLFGMMNWMYSWYDPKGEIKPAEISRLIYTIFTNGVKTSFPPPAARRGSREVPAGEAKDLLLEG
ncbi:MAG: TetR/AcrR family transcriptional regulator [Syntrophorhabdales bacterium]|jgi:AcrR family transcriptional regulator